MSKQICLLIPVKARKFETSCHNAFRIVYAFYTQLQTPNSNPCQRCPRRPSIQILPLLNRKVEPFDVHVNPSILRSLTAYLTPVSFTEGSPEAVEVPFPHSQLRASTPPYSSVMPLASKLDNSNLAGDDTGILRGSSAGKRVSTDFEKSAMTASASVRVLASQVSLQVSSYTGGPAFIAIMSHVFLRAVTWPAGVARSRESSGGADGPPTAKGEAQKGPEMFVRLSRVACRVICCSESSSATGSQGNGRLGDSARIDQKGDTVLKPFDLDVHLTRPREDGNTAVSVTPNFLFRRGWHAGVYIDEIYLRFGAEHVRNLELLADLFLPAMAAAELTATELMRGQQAQGMAASKQGSSSGRASDLRVLKRVECCEYPEETSLRPEPGEAVFYGIGTRQDEGGTAVRTSLPKYEEGGEDGWVTCCEWHYWGLRRVAQIALPHAPLCGSIPLLEGLIVDSLEVELKLVNPLSGAFEASFTYFLLFAGVGDMWKP